MILSDYWQLFPDKMDESSLHQSAADARYMSPEQCLGVVEKDDDANAEWARRHGVPPEQARYHYVKREFQMRYTGSVLGVTWNVLNPLAMIIIYTVVFSEVLRKSTPANGRSPRVGTTPPRSKRSPAAITQACVSMKCCISGGQAAHLHDKTQAFTLFATHYFELTEFPASHHAAVNVHVSAAESGHDIVFLHEIQSGPASRSYGIQVARLAGVPKPVLERAKEILRNLEESELTPEGNVRQATRRQKDREKLQKLGPAPQLDLFG